MCHLYLMNMLLDKRKNQETITFRKLKIRILGLFNPIKMSNSFSPVQQCQPQSDIHCIYKGGSFECPALGHRCKGQNSQPRQNRQLKIQYQLSLCFFIQFIYAYHIYLDQ